MKQSIKEELKQYIIDNLPDFEGTELEELHHNLFNVDYYMVYHSKCIEWLQEHELDVFEAIEIVRDYELENFGAFDRDINPESIVNMLVYIYGEELLAGIDIWDYEGELTPEIISELTEKLEEL